MKRQRRKSVVVKVGSVSVGGAHPIVIQSMTDTDTADVKATFSQVAELAKAGSEIVRVTVANDESARAIGDLKRMLSDAGLADLPIVGDFHFIGHRLLADNAECAAGLDKFRINPGNIGRAAAKDKNFTRFIEIAKEYDKPVRIGVNAGSLDPEILTAKMDANARQKTPKTADEVEADALVESAVRSAELAESIGLAHDKIILSCKVSDFSQVVAVYREIAQKTDYPLHLGLTEAGFGLQGIALTTAALSLLLYEGIGDTIRASLTPRPGEDRTREVELCKEILQAVGARQIRPRVTSCPGCGRTTSAYFRELAQTINAEIDKKMPTWQARYPGSESMVVAVMGCVVNGPGESRKADIGLSLPGTGELPVAPVYVDGERKCILKGDKIGEEFMDLIEQYVADRWAPNAAKAVSGGQS